MYKIRTGFFPIAISTGVGEANSAKDNKKPHGYILFLGFGEVDVLNKPSSETSLSRPGLLLPSREVLLLLTSANYARMKGMMSA